MKKFAKHFLKVLLAAMVASMTVTSAFALEAEQVETAQEISIAAASAAYYAEDKTVALGASESTVLSFDNEITAVNLGTTEALLTYSEDNKSVTIEGVGYAGVVTAMDGTQTKSVSFYSGTKFKPGLNIRFIIPTSATRQARFYPVRMKTIPPGTIHVLPVSFPANGAVHRLPIVPHWIPDRLKSSCSMPVYVKAFGLRCRKPTGRRIIIFKTMA